MGLSGSQSLKNGMKCLKRPTVAFHTLLSIWGPFSPTKSVSKVPFPLSFDNRGTEVEYIHFSGNDFLVFSSDFVTLKGGSVLSNLSPALGAFHVSLV